MSKDPTADILKAMAKGTSKAHSLTDGAGSDVVTIIPTGVDVLDKYVLGCGGLPCGRVVELYGPPGSGKSSLVAAAISSAQDMGIITYLQETESALNSARLPMFGVDPGKLILTEPEHWGEVMEHLDDFLGALPDNTPALVALDSVAATPSVEEWEHGVGKQAKRDCRAKDISQFMRRVTNKLKRKQACLLLVNQTRQNIGVVFGSNVAVPGGEAIKFHSSIRLHLMGGKKDKNKEGEVIAIAPIAYAEKNKLAQPFRKARFYLNIMEGFDNERSTVELARDLSLMSGRERKLEKAEAMLTEKGVW